MSSEIPLEAMSVADKLQLMERVWSSLCQHSGDVESPEWHQQVLQERARRLENGKSAVSSWNDAKARLLQLGQ